MSDTDDFLAEDYRFTADLLRRYAAGATSAGGTDTTSLFRAVCSNNLNIILAALVHAEKVAPRDEKELQRLRENRDLIKDMLG